jgi:hypothetical protein
VFLEANKSRAISISYNSKNIYTRDERLFGVGFLVFYSEIFLLNRSGSGYEHWFEVEVKNMRSLLTSMEFNHTQFTYYNDAFKKSLTALSEPAFLK